MATYGSAPYSGAPYGGTSDPAGGGATPISGSDSATGLETASVAIAISGSDSAAVVDVVGRIALAASDSGVGSDSPIPPTSSVTVELWESGSYVETLGTFDISNAPGEILDVTFDASVLSDPTGAGVELRLFTSSGHAIDIGAIEWLAEIQTPISSGVSKSDSDSGTGVESVQIVASLAASDAAAVAETASLAIVIDVTDSSQCGESASFIEAMTLAGAVLARAGSLSFDL